MKAVLQNKQARHMFGGTKKRNNNNKKKKRKNRNLCICIYIYVYESDLGRTEQEKTKQRFG